MTEHELSPAENERIQELLDSITARYSSVEDEEFLAEAALYGHELPRSLRAALHRFKLHEPESAVLMISGYPVDSERIGPTPSHWSYPAAGSPTLREEVFMVLCGAVLGDAIAWATQQDGRLVHDILPVRGHEGEQLGTGSEQLLWWHTEDAFHPYRGDYLGMMCLRNPDAVATTVATLEELELPDGVVEVLFQPRFTIRPDESHLPKNRSRSEEIDGDLSSSYQRIESMVSRPDRIPVLFGDRRSPYMRLDPYFMDRLEDDPEAQEALDQLVRAIDARLMDQVLRPGDLCFIDNFKAVHGRKPFKARFDGSDRWLKRINVARDLRRSRDARPAAASRVLQ